MSELIASVPVPGRYRRIEGSERRLAPGMRRVRGADSQQRLSVIVRLKSCAGPAGLDQLAVFFQTQGLELVGRKAIDLLVVVAGTVARLNEVFAVQLEVCESSAGNCRAFTGHVHLPSGLAEIVENVFGLAEGEIENIESVIGALLGTDNPREPGDPRIIFDLIVPLSGPKGAVNPGEFSLVQIFDLGWLFDPGCQRMLDNLAASPGAFKTVRVMKVFTNSGAAGMPETGIVTGLVATTSSGTVWPAGGPGSAINFTDTLNALYELTSRGLVPFVVLGFFPAGVYNGTGLSASPPTGPLEVATTLGGNAWGQILANWQTLVQAFFTALFTDPQSRFPASAVANWWFEVWNEPDESFFWGPDVNAGSLTCYQQLYQATATVVSNVMAASGQNIRLGGPAITGPSVAAEDGPMFTPLMTPFIQFVQGQTDASGNPTPKGLPIKCDFLSFHGKGAWDACLNGQPSLQAAIDAADQTASAAKAAGLTSIFIINNEADLRASFAIPFKPRMTEQFPAWLTGMMIAYDSLSSEYAPMRFLAGSDNAEPQLVGNTQSPSDPDSVAFVPAAFGQQRTLMTAASTWSQGTCPADLLKIPVYNFYELLRLLGDQHGTFLSGAQNYYPHNSDLFHLITVGTTQIGSVFCVYPPNPPSGAAQTSWTLNYSIAGISWPAINWYQFQIDGTHSNGFTAAGGPAAEPDASRCTPEPMPPTSLPLPLSFQNVSAIRGAQELSVVAYKTNTTPPFKISVKIPQYTTILFWITPWSDATPDAPVWMTTAPFTVETTSYGRSVILRWVPGTDPAFYSYEVYRDGQLVSPNSRSTPEAMALRAALWVDTIKLDLGRGTLPTRRFTYTYTILAVSASGIASDFSAPLTVSIA